MSGGDFRVKKLNELIEGFPEVDSSINVDEDRYWPIFDFKRNQKFLLPIGTAVNFFSELLQGIAEDGVLDDNGEPRYYFGECLGNTRPLRMRFEASIYEENLEEGEDGINMIYKSLISCIVMALGNKFERTSHGKEYRVCGLMYSTDINTDKIDVTIYFPYCRLKTSDFKNIFIPNLCHIMDSQLGNNLYSKFLGVDKAMDIISPETFLDAIPFYGCVSDSDDYPKNKIECWYVNEIPRRIDDIIDADISQGDDDLVLPSEHLIFERDMVPKPKTLSQQVFWRPIIYTNSFWKQRLVLLSTTTQEVLKVDETRVGGEASASFNTRQSPYMRRIQQRRETATGQGGSSTDYSQISKESADKRIIADVIQHIIETDDYRSIPYAKKNAVVKFIRYNMYMKEIQDLINLFVTKERWFKMSDVKEYPPIQVNNEGFHLTFDKVSFILDHLNPRRCEITSQVEDIACVIYTMARTYEEREEARHIFVEFVRENFQAFRERGMEAGVSDIFMKQIKRASKKRITFWSLLSMFEEDDPIYYNLWWKYICDYYVIHALDSEMASFPVARAASLPLIGKYIHTTGDARQTWWKYTGTFWRNIHDTQSIELELTTSFVKSIRCVEKRYGDIVASMSSKKVSFSVLCDKLNESSFRGNIVKDMSNVLLRDNRLLTFSAGTDPEYADFFASINYVYQYSDGEMRRRPGHWEDFLTKTFDVIDECLPLTDPRCQFILSWVHKMLRDPATEHEFLKDLGSMVRGFNRDKRFSVWYGHGNGGKSKFMDLVCSTMGLTDGYAFKLPLESMLEGAKKSSGSADPAIDQGRGAFLAVLDEPKKGQKFDASKIKSNTGNDPMYNRTIFSKGGTFRPMFKTVMLGNVLPKADYDMAMKIRFWVWHFAGRFADPDDCPKTPEEQERLGIYPLDKDLDNKIPDYKAAMLSIMLHYYKLYCKEGVRRTEGIRRATDMFWNSANDVLCFMSEQTVQIKDMDTYVSIDDLYDAFRRWFMNRNNGDRIVSKLLFSEELEAIYVTQKVKAQGGIAGIRLRDGV